MSTGHDVGIGLLGGEGLDTKPFLVKELRSGELLCMGRREFTRPIDWKEAEFCAGL